MFAILPRVAASFTLLILAVAISAPLHAEDADNVNALNARFIELYQQGKYAEASEAAQQALKLSERVLGPEDPHTLASMSNLAASYRVQGRYDEAEPLFKRAYEVFQRVAPPDDTARLSSASNLAEFYRNRGRYAEAEPLSKAAAEGFERVLGPDHPSALITAGNLAELYRGQGRYDEAEPLFRRVLEASKRALGPDDPDTLMNANNLANLLNDQGKYAESARLLERTYKAQERVLGKNHPDTLLSLGNLASVQKKLGHYKEAETLFKRGLEAKEQVLGRNHESTLRTVGNLADLYRTQQRLAEAEPLARRALEGKQRTLGADHPSTLISMNNLAIIYDELRSYDKAEALYKRVLKTQERTLGKNHPSTLLSANNLAAHYVDRGNQSEAEPLYRQVLAARERVIGKNHPQTLLSLHNLATLEFGLGRFDKAEPLMKRALEAREWVLGPDHPQTLEEIDNLAVLYYAQRDYARAVRYWRRSTATILKRTSRGTHDIGGTPASKKKSEVELLGGQFWGLIKAAYRLGSKPDLSRETFETAQWAIGSEAAAALTRMAARGASGAPALAALVRERQDLVDDWQKRDARRNTALGEAPEKRNRAAEAKNNVRLGAIERRIAAIDERLKSDFPDYAALASPTALSVEDVQNQLGADEALVLFLDTKKFGRTPEETFIWVVTRAEMRWVRSDLGTEALATEVQALRCGLDEAAWAGPHCGELTGQDFALPLPFDHRRAYNLYKALFGQVEDLINGKHLLLVPSGALTQLPFQVLITKPPRNGDHRSAAWLARDHALTVLPAVSSLKSLRRVGHPSAATKPMIGFGNPLLDGQAGHDGRLAQLARAKQSCGNTTPDKTAGLFKPNRGMAVPKMTDALANVSLIRIQAPLPETADELCAVAHDVHADPDDIRLGARATEREVKALSESGQLADYRIVHFATHGAMAGELQGTNQPGLLLTPPAKASREDDGYLSASEIAGLKLDADWVILSACNTAAGNAANAEALSGLARVFFYAQARALLVSHWAVDSDSTVKLITSAMHQLSSNPAIGRSEALRRAMMSFVDDPASNRTHPSYWAPFIVVGEGAFRP